MAGTYQSRVRQEYGELSSKLLRLTDFLRGNPTYATLPQEEQQRLGYQMMFMRGYLAVLLDRIANFPPD